MKIHFNWDASSGEALCTIQEKDNFYYGTAVCASQDKDMMNEKTGCFIAEKRAKINMLKHKKEELKIELKALKKYYYSMNTSKYFNETSYPIKRLKDHMLMIEIDIKEIKELISYEKGILNRYIKEKDNFYQQIRNNRKKK